MEKYVCSICGYVYDEAKGVSASSLPAGTKWNDVSDDFVCPLCKASKENFAPNSTKKPEQSEVKAIELTADLSQFSTLEMSVLCSNLARGCEKQYLPEEQEQFNLLASYFKSATPKSQSGSTDELAELVKKDLQELIPYANQTASAHKDRGAMRALVWGEKVTRIINMLLERYQKEGDAMFQNKDIYICTICGYIHIDNALPEICPICKVPNYKFEKVEG